MVKNANRRNNTMARTKKTRDTATFAKDDFLALVVAFIDLDGWVSSGEAYKHGTPEVATARRAWASLKLDAGLDAHGVDATTVKAYSTANAAIVWFTDSLAGKTNPSEFEVKLLVALAEPLVNKFTAGIVASLINIYYRHLANAATATEESAASDYVGTVGERITVTLKVIKVSSFFGRYGETTIYRMRDDTGNIFTWFSLSMSVLHDGATYTVTGTVKKHDDFRGVKGTVLTRCKVEK